MPDAFAQVLATPGLFWLLLTFGLAGVVRGFTGFGTALIVVPVANIFLDPKAVITIVAHTGIASNAVILPRVLHFNRPACAAKFAELERTVSGDEDRAKQE